MSNRAPGPAMPEEMRIEPDRTSHSAPSPTEDHPRAQRERRHAARLAANHQRKLGQELHDQLGQELAGLHYLAAALQRNLEDADRPEAMAAERLVQALQQTVVQVRSWSRGLLASPIEAKDFRLTLDELLSRTQADYHVDCRLDCSVDQPFLDNTRTTHLFRIVQEAIHNAVKHARPECIHVRISRHDHDTLLASIRDDGIGPPPLIGQSPGVGIRIMRYRAHCLRGQIILKAAPPRGTIVTCLAPL